MSCAPSHNGDQASELSLQGVLHEVLVQREVGDQLLELPIFLLEMLELARLDDAQPRSYPRLTLAAANPKCTPVKPAPFKPSRAPQCACARGSI